MDMIQQLCERFLAQMDAHHRARDHYPDPREVGAELHLSTALTQAVVEELWARRWVARSPYDTERLRVTPRGWEQVRRQVRSDIAGVDRVLAIVPTGQERTTDDGVASVA